MLNARQLPLADPLRDRWMAPFNVAMYSVRHVWLHVRRRGEHRMGMAAPRTDWTVQDVHALPDDGKRYEVIEGELLVTPAPSLPHQVAVGELWLRLREHLRTHPTGTAHMSPANIIIGPQTLVQPDVFVAPMVEGRPPRAWPEIRSLLLAVEVLSPGTARSDRQVKRRLYQRWSVPEYWIVDLDARLVERWRPEDERPEIVSERLEWGERDDRLVIDLQQFFQEVLAD